MPGHEPHKRVEPIEKVEPQRSEPRIDDTETATAAKFDEALQKADPSKVERREEKPPEIQPPPVERESPMEMATKVAHEAPKSSATVSGIVEQTSSISRSLARPRAVLLDSKELVAQLDKKTINDLSSSIQHADRALQDAIKIGTEVEVGSLVPAEKPAFTKFLHFLTEGEKRLSGFMDEIKALDLQKQKLTPERLLAVQVKLGFVQQQLEFFTTTLNKGLESIKTVMNVQI